MHDERPKASTGNGLTGASHSSLEQRGTCTPESYQKIFSQFWHGSYEYSIRSLYQFIGVWTRGPGNLIQVL